MPSLQLPSNLVACPSCLPVHACPACPAGAGTPLPMFAPYEKLEFLAAGGTSEDYATTETGASDQAQVIDVSSAAAGLPGLTCNIAKLPAGNSYNTGLGLLARLQCSGDRSWGSGGWGRGLQGQGLTCGPISGRGTRRAGKGQVGPAAGLPGGRPERQLPPSASLPFTTLRACPRQGAHSTSRTDLCPRPQLTAGTAATWRDVGPMPLPRVMGDSVILCDGTVGIFNGAAKGIAVSQQLLACRGCDL